MDARHLELLRELSDRGSVTAVATATHRTPSAVSQQLRTAQREFGAPLVEPSGRGLRLTEAGLLLAEGGREVACALERVQARWDAFRGQPTGTVRIAALPSAATFLMPAVLRELSDLPIDVLWSDFDIAEAAFGGLASDFDIVIAHSLAQRAPASTDGLTTVELVREPLDIAMRTGHRLAVGTSVLPRDLVEVEWYGVPLGYPFDSVRIAVESATGLRVPIVQRLRDNRLVEALVASSDRVAVLPRFTTPTGAGIALRPVDSLATARFIFAVMRPDRAERAVVTRVLEALRRVATDVGRQHAIQQ